MCSAFAFDSYLTLYLCVNGVAVSEVTDTHAHTHTHTDKLSTVTLAAHARRGLISNKLWKKTGKKKVHTRIRTSDMLTEVPIEAPELNLSTFLVTSGSAVKLGIYSKNRRWKTAACSRDTGADHVRG